MNGTLAAIGILILILDSKTAANGIREGVTICLQSVVPSLFPFIYLSNILTSSISFQRANKTNRKTSRFPILSEHPGLLLTGYLGGYPVGAQCVAQAYQNRQISRQKAHRLLICCNNPGPAFIFGITGTIFSQRWVPWLLWGIHILSSLLMFLVIPTPPERYANSSEQRNSDCSTNLLQTIRSMAYICGWVTLFKCVIKILRNWCLWLLPEAWEVIICGLLEMTNGCLLLKEINCIGLRFLLCAFFLSFGGVCAVIQTHCVAGGVPCHNYLGSKLLEGVWSLILAYYIQLFLLPSNQQIRISSLFHPAAAGMIFLVTFIIIKSKNNSRNLVTVGV